MLDIFKNDAFGVIPLTDTINELSFVPGRIGKMGIFRSSSVAATSIAIERKGDDLILVPPTPRGGPGTTVAKKNRSMLSLAIPHFEINDAVMAEEVQGVRAYGSESDLETVQGFMVERMAQHRQSFEATHEYSRIGAVKGVVTYADGSELDLFTTFGVSQIAEIDFDLDNANPAGGVLRKKVSGLYRTVADVLGGIPFTGLTAICGDAFFDDLIAHKEVRETYLQQQEATQLRKGYLSSGADGSYGSFNFGDVTWENYRGQVGNTRFVDTDKCHIFPTGAPDLFRTVYAPADYNETVNTMGKELYAKLYEMQNGKGMHFDLQTNAIHFCKRPKALLKGKRT